MLKQKCRKYTVTLMCNLKDLSTSALEVQLFISILFYVLM